MSNKEQLTPLPLTTTTRGGGNNSTAYTRPRRGSGGGGGILTRRSSAMMPTPKRQSYGTGNEENSEEDDNPMEGFWLYPEILDIIALVAALSLGVGTASVFSYSYEDLHNADERYLIHDPTGYWARVGGNHPISTGLMTFSGLSITISTFALVVAVAVRIMLTYATNMKPSSAKRKFLLSWANPCAVLTVILFTLGTLLTAPTLFFVGWIAYPPDIADEGIHRTLGVACMVCIGLLFALTIYLVYRVKKIGAQEKEEEEAAAAAAAAAASKLNQQRNNNHIRDQKEQEE